MIIKIGNIWLLLYSGIITILLFLKSSINEILLDLYKRWKDKKEKRRKTLIEMRNLLLDYHTYYIKVMLFGIPYFTKGIDKDTLAEFGSYFKPANNALNECSKKIDILLFEVPKKLSDQAKPVLSDASNLLLELLPAKLNPNYIQSANHLSMRESFSEVDKIQKRIETLMRNTEDMIN